MLDLDDVYRKFVILDPGDLDASGRPRVIAYIGLILSRPRYEVRNQDEYEAAIDRILTDAEHQAALEELGAVYSWESFCSHCGTGLGMTSCPKCKRTFTYDGLSGSTCFDLPHQVRKWLKDTLGHVFES